MAASDRAETVALVAATALLAVALGRELRQPIPQSKRDVPATPSAHAEFAPEIAQSGRGRRATSPLQIPWKGWKDILWRTYEQINDDRLLATAAGVVFYGLLAVFPAITALVSLYGLFADPSTIGSHLESLALMLPQGSFQIVQDQIERVLAKGNASLGFTFAFGLLLALWSANAGVKAVIDALNVVYGEKEKRGFFKLNALSLAMTMGTIGGLLLMVAAVVALPIVLNHIWITDQGKALLSLSRWPVMFGLLIMALAVLYRFGPSRPSARWQWLSIGAVVAAVSWIAGSSLLSYYLSNFGNYDATYGSLGAAIGLMTWMWMSAITVLCGAELNSEIEHQTAYDTTVGAGKPLGLRGASMADTVGAAQT